MPQRVAWFGAALVSGVNTVERIRTTSRSRTIKSSLSFLVSTADPITTTTSHCRVQIVIATKVPI